MSIHAFIKRHPIPLYFILTFLISWGAILLTIGGISKIPGTTDETDRLLPSVILAMLTGPTISGIVMTALVHGKRGLRDFLARLLRWRVGLQWYAVALLATPILSTVILFGLALNSPVFLPGILQTSDKLTLILTGIAVGLSAGIFEELGWTGFVIPEMRQRHGMVKTGLIVGLLWGAWHYMVAFWGSGDATGAFTWMLFLPHMLFYIAVLPAYRILMVWVYDHTSSLLIAILMHASLTGGVLFIFMPAIGAGVPLIIWYAVMAAVLWLMVGLIAAVNSRHPTHPRQYSQMHMASH